MADQGRVLPLSAHNYRRAHELFISIVEEIYRGDAWAIQTIRALFAVERFFRMLFDMNAAMFVAVEETSMAGIGIGTSAGGIVRIEMLGVIPTLRRRGIGTQLLHSLESDFLQRGCHGIELFAQEGDQSVTFYEKRGYSVHARLQRYFFKRDFVYMTKSCCSASSVLSEQRIAPTFPVA